jgi:2-hydroxy-6-oxonona-2,4-dienedioate hydrolase
MSFWTHALGAEIRFISAAGVRTRYLTIGKGPDLVLLHGRGGHLESWAKMLPLLARNYRVHAFDLGGHGLSGALQSYDVGALTRHASDALTAAGVTRCSLVGQSVGGWIAMRIALANPALVLSLALVEPTGLQSEEERLTDAHFTESYRRGGEAFHNPTRAAVAARLRGLFHDAAGIDDELLETRWRLYQSESSRRTHLAVRAADNAEFLLLPPDFATLRQRLLFIRGDAAHTPASIIESAAACANARVHAIHKARQWPQYEHADEVAAVLHEFFSIGSTQ